MQDNPLTQLLEADRRSLLRAAARLIGPAEAEDAVQDAYVRALEADALSLNTTQAWLLTVVRNLAIDRWRRREWMVQWTREAAFDVAHTRQAPSAEEGAALAQQVTWVMRQLAALLTPVDGAALLLHAVFDVEHAEIARAAGRTEAANRQQLRRALQRLRRRADADSDLDTDVGHEHVFRAYLHALHMRDPHILWGMLREPPIRALARASNQLTAPAQVATPGTTVGGLVQLGGQLGLVLSLDGVQLCVVPLGTCTERGQDAWSECAA